MSIEAWLDKVSRQDDVKGVLLIDNDTGLSLGARGVAKNDDAPYFKWYCESNLTDTDVAKVEFRDNTVYLKVDKKALIAVYKDDTVPDSGSRLSFEGT